MKKKKRRQGIVRESKGERIKDTGIMYLEKTWILNSEERTPTLTNPPPPVIRQLAKAQALLGS